MITTTKGFYNIFYTSVIVGFSQLVNLFNDCIFSNLFCQKLLLKLSVNLSVKFYIIDPELHCTNGTVLML